MALWGSMVVKLYDTSCVQCVIFQQQGGGAYGKLPKKISARLARTCSLGTQGRRADYRPTLDEASVKLLRVELLPAEGLPTRPMRGSRGMASKERDLSTGGLSMYYNAGPPGWAIRSRTNARRISEDLSAACLLQCTMMRCFGWLGLSLWRGELKRVCDVTRNFHFWIRDKIDTVGSGGGGSTPPALSVAARLAVGSTWPSSICQEDAV